MLFSVALLAGLAAAFPQMGPTGPAPGPAGPGAVGPGPAGSPPPSSPPPGPASGPAPNSASLPWQPAGPGDSTWMFQCYQWLRTLWLTCYSRQITMPGPQHPSQPLPPPS